MERLVPTDLKCEHLLEPKGLNTVHPRFTWAVSGDGRNRRQSAYQIVAGTRRDMVVEGQGELWDTGKVASSDTLLIPYAGRPLSSHLRFYWSVRVWDETGRMSSFACPAGVDTGLMQPSDWTAKWIARDEIGRIGRMAPTTTPYDNPHQARPADYLRRTFPVGGAVRRAVVYATALGVYSLRLNGRVMGDVVLAPGWTDYHKRVEYQLHDVTDSLVAGQNVLAAVLGEGWYSGRVGNTVKRQGAHYGPKPALLCQLIVDYEDGRREVVSSDGTWRAARGPIVYSDMLLGEKYDARLEAPGWDSVAFDDAAWDAAEEIAPWPRPPQLDAARAQPVRRTEELPGRLLHVSAGGGLIYDLGQNIAGWIRLGVTAPAGATIEIRHGEALTAGGELYTENLRSARATDTYVAGGGGAQWFEPSFTVHGFRYVEIRGPGLGTANVTVTGIQVNSDTPPTGRFTCGSALVNKLVANIQWSQRGNFLSIPTDCPQRDERLGWLADAQVFWPTATYNMDIAAFFTKWMLDIEDAQQDDGAFTDVAPSKPHWAHNPFPPKGAPAWGDGAVILVWLHYLHYGDRELLARYWPALVRWMDYIERQNPALVRERALNRNYGDWLSIGRTTSKEMIATAYWAHMADLMAKGAAALHRADDAARFAKLAASIKGAFVRRFVSEDGSVESDTQTAYLLALDFDMLEPELRGAAAGHLRRTLAETDHHLATGFLGVRHLCPVLADIGESELAYRLLLTETYPSWLFPVANGATTIWERWDGWTPDRGFQTPNMNSFNHYAYGAVGQWLFERVAGIAPDPNAPGFRHLVCRPLPHPALSPVKAEYRSHLGLVSVQWAVREQSVRYELQVPANVSASVTLPKVLPEAVRLDGLPIAQHPDVGAVEESGDTLIVKIGSGIWAFEWPLLPQRKSGEP